jgi:hypothetical protein
LGRIAVDCSIVAFAALVIYAITKLRRGAFKALAAYFCFFPFIVWWDPGSHKWFLVANIFLTAFLVCGLTSRLHYKPARLAIVFCLLIIAGTNFITTIRPRHADRGRDNRIADCVAGHMRSKDLFVAAEWGWPDYLPYLHKRSMINIINEFAQFQNREKTLAGVRIAVDETRKEGGDTYMANPQGAFDFDWLNRTTGVTRKDLSSFGGAPSFVCYDVTIDRIN